MKAAQVVKLRPRQILEQHRAEIEVMCAAGCAWDDIADLTGVGRPTVINWAESEGIVKNNKPKPAISSRRRAALTWTDERDAKLLALCDTNITDGELAVKMGASKALIAARLTFLGLPNYRDHNPGELPKPARSKGGDVISVDDFEVWSKYAKAAKTLIYWRGDFDDDNRALTNLEAAMTADKTVDFSENEDGYFVCVKLGEEPRGMHGAEQRLWQAVINQALSDACMSISNSTGPEDRCSRDRARAWITRPSADLREACDCAGYNMDNITHMARKLSARGWPRARFPYRRRERLSA